MFQESDSAVQQQAPTLKDFRRAGQAALSSHSCWLNNTVLPLHHLPHAPITLQQPCSLPGKVPMHVRSHTEQSDCGSSAFAHIFTIIQYELVTIKLLLQQLTIVPKALQFQDIPINT